MLVRFYDELGSYAVIWRASKERDCFVAPDGTVLAGGGTDGGHPDQSTYSKFGAELAGWGDAPVPEVTATTGHQPRGIPAGCGLAPPAKFVPCTSMSTGMGPGLRNGQNVYGTIGRDTARVVITWAGRAPVTAAIRGHYVAARYFDAAGSPLRPGVKFRVQAYDAHGKLLSNFVQED